MRNCKDCVHCIITPGNVLHNEDVCDLCYGRNKWVSKYSCKEEKEMKKYEIIIRTDIRFTKTIEAESRDKAISLALDTLDGTYFKNRGMHNYAYCTGEYLRTDDIMSCKEIETKKPLILLCGKSGSGKTTVANLLQSKYGLRQLKSYTTRPRRSDDECGHVFAEENVFEHHKEGNRIVADATINGYKYWATKEQLDRRDVYVIDPKTALELAEKVKDEREVIIVYLCCSDTTRVYRMTKRGDALEDIQKRIINEARWGEGIYHYTGIIIDTDTYSPEQIAEYIMTLKEKCE